MPKRKRSKSPIPDCNDDDLDDDFSSTDSKTGLPIQRNAANARERARMRVLSSAFYKLKTIIPWVPRDTKLSKLDTLRLATNYINYLAQTLDGQPGEEISHSMPHPQKLTWPFIFSQMPDLRQMKPVIEGNEHNDHENNCSNGHLSSDMSNYGLSYEKSNNSRWKIDFNEIDPSATETSSVYCIERAKDESNFNNNYDYSYYNIKPKN